MALEAALLFLRLDRINQVWVDALWDYEFTEAEPLDAAVEEEICDAGAAAFRKLHDCLLQYAGEGEASVNIWGLFGQSGVSPRTLVAVLSYFVLKGKSKAAGGRQRIDALHAASIYLLLLGIPGSIANQVFHQVLFDTCSDLSSHCWPQESSKKRKKDGVKNSQVDSKRSKLPRSEGEQMDEDEEEHDDDEEEEQVHLSAQDLVKIRDGVVVLVQSLLRLLQTLSLKDKTQSANNCAQMFAKLIYFEPVVEPLSFAAVGDVSQLKRIPELAFHGLRLLCSPHHGDQTEGLRRVFQRLLFVILMMSKTGSGKPSLLGASQTVMAARDHALHFVCQVVEDLTEAALPLLHVLLQHVCYQMVERSEFRYHGAKAVGTLASQLPSAGYAKFSSWLYSYSKHSKMVFRLFAVDVAMVLLEQPERTADSSVPPEQHHFLLHRFLVHSLLFPRQTDPAPTVRAHALSCLAQCLEGPSLNATRAVQDLFSSSGTQTVLEDNDTQGSLVHTQKTYGTLPFKTVEISSTESHADGAKENLALLFRRISDAKTNVRKSALQALVGLLRHGLVPHTSENLLLLSERCRDPSLSVKKKALQCLGELLVACPGSVLVQSAWLQGVVPAVVDSETSVQEKALEALEQVLLFQVKPYDPQGHMDVPQRLAWDLLGLLCRRDHNLSQFFTSAFSVWSQQSKFSSAFFSALLSHTEADQAGAAWMLLSKVAGCAPQLSCGPVLCAWERMLGSKDFCESTCCHILRVMGDISVHLNEDTKSRIVAELVSWLGTLQMSLSVISVAVETLFQLGRREDIKETQAFLNEHCGELLSLSENFLSDVLLREDGAQNPDNKLLVKNLHLLGVASLHCPARVSKRTILLVESILTSTQDGPPGPEFRSRSLSSRVRAHGVITLGKLCLQNEELTQKHLPALARLLEEGGEVVVRNNVVVVLGDLCVRHTNMVDRYIPNMSACLRDDQQVIREQTLIMLTNLLQEEFVKWKGSLFFRFVAVLVDPVPSIASLCEYCLVHLLLKKNPTMFSQNFIECIFHFNSYDHHKTYNRFVQSDRNKMRFSMKGAQNREKRFKIYRFMLGHFSDAQRFSATGKINQTVLACFADEELPLDADGADILSETFSILSLQEMKLKVTSSSAGGDAEEEPEENMAAKAVLQATHKKVVSQVQKKVFIENTIPVVIALKNLLEQKRSPVLQDLMAYLQVTVQDYRCEVTEFFLGDEQLAAELEYDLKMFDQEREEREKEMNRSNLGGGAAGDAVAVSSPRIHTVSVQNSPEANQITLQSFLTPQPQRINRLLSRLSLTEQRQAPPSSASVARGHSQGESAGRSYVSLAASVMRKGDFTTRAISTPVDVEFNLTFGEAMSAIDSDDTSPGFLQPLNRDKTVPAPSQWNVQSPLRQRR